MKQAIPVGANEALLQEELRRKKIVVAVSGGVMRFPRDPDPEERAVIEEVLAEHKPRKRTAEQKRLDDVESDIEAVRGVVDFKPGVVNYETFASMDFEKLRQVVYLLWLQIEGRS